METYLTTAGVALTTNMPPIQRKIESWDELSAKANTAPTGCWLVFSAATHSGVAVYNSELEALRHAVSEKLDCRWVEWGQDLRLPYDPRIDS